MFKVMTLNLWGYHEWEKRSHVIVSLINQAQPDCITLQEVQTNHAFSHFPSSDFIANNCGYTYRSFAPTFPRNNARDRQGNRTQRVSHGQAFLSKHPITSSENYFLQYHQEHPEEHSVQFCDVLLGDTRVQFCNVHFANNSIFAEAHLKELLTLLDQRGSQPIILGDFNIWLQDMKVYKKHILRNYHMSVDVTEYISMPSDKNTIDYILLPATTYSFREVTCYTDYVSDHRAIMAAIDTL